MNKDKTKNLYLKYSEFLMEIRPKKEGISDSEYMHDWYFFVNRKQWSINYIDVGGTKDGDLNSDNDLYHRISKHFGIGSGASFCKNYYRNITKLTREKWIKTLKKNYDLMVIYAPESNIGKNEL